MKPEYSNGFTVSFNSELGEMVIIFTHQYPSGDGVESQDVASVALPETVARELYKRLPDVFPEE